MVEPIIPKERIVTPAGNIIEMVAWIVPPSNMYEEGVKYSFALIHDEKRVIGFDNFQHEGHHKHYFDNKELYVFQNLEATKKQFLKLVEEFEGDKK